MAGVKTDQGRARRVAMFKFVRQHLKDHGYPPRTKEMAETVKVPYTTVLFHLRSLRDQKFLAFEDGDIGRTLRVGRNKDEGAIE